MGVSSLPPPHTHRCFSKCLCSFVLWKMCNFAGLKVTLSLRLHGIWAPLTEAIWGFSLLIPLCWHIQSFTWTTCCLAHHRSHHNLQQPRLRSSFDLNHLSSLWALHLVEWGLGNHCAFCQTYCNAITALKYKKKKEKVVIYSGIIRISDPMLLKCNFPLSSICALSFLFVHISLFFSSIYFRLTSGKNI